MNHRSKTSAAGLGPHRVVDWPDPSKLIGHPVEFVLQYKGDLPSGAREDRHSAIKQQVRLEFSKQLARCWRRPVLAHWLDLPLTRAQRNADGSYEPDDTQHPFYFVETCGFHAIPMVTRANGLRCELDIEISGDESGLVGPKGDLDNRLKVLFDALRLPHSNNEVPGSMFGGGTDRLFTLLEDDSLIRKFSVEAIQSPYSPAEHDVRIKVRVVMIDTSHPFLAEWR